MSSALILLVVGLGVYYLYSTGQLQPLLQKLGIGFGGSTSAKTPAPTSTPTAPTQAVGETYQSVVICQAGCSPPIQFRVDSGADYSIIRTDSAQYAKLNTSNPVRTQNITTVSGQVAAPVIQVNMKIGDRPVFQTELVVLQGSNFNLLAMRDVTRVYDVKFTSGGTQFTPKSAFARANSLEGLRTRYYMRL